MFGLGSLQMLGIAGAIALVVGFGAGWKVRDAFCDAAEAKRQVVELNKQIEARDVAAKRDAERFEKDAVVRGEMEKQIRELESKIGVGQCLSSDDTNSLRSLWPQQRRNARPRSR